MARMNRLFSRRASRRQVLRRIGGAGMMAAVATWLGGGQGGSLPFVGGGKPQELIMGYGVDQLSTTGLDPQIHSGTAAESQLRNCYDCLVQISKDLKTVEPQLATEWKRINPTTMQFKLREDVRFHNG